MKRMYFLVVFLIITILYSGEGYSQNFVAIADTTLTIYYLPDTTTFCDICPVAGEIFSIHSRFPDEPGQLQSFKLIEVEFLISRWSIGDTISELTIFRDTLKTQVYSLIINDVIDSSDAYPNWYKITIPDSPVFTDYIEIAQPPIWPVFAENPPSPSGNTLGFIDAVQRWGVVHDYPVKIKLRGIVSSTPGEKKIPASFQLHQNYPNPFNPVTKIKWQSPESGIQTIKIYDILGNEIAVIVNEYRSAGIYEIRYDASALPSGVYFYSLKSGNFFDTKKMILLK